MGIGRRFRRVVEEGGGSFGSVAVGLIVAVRACSRIVVERGGILNGKHEKLARPFLCPMDCTDFMNGGKEGGRLARLRWSGFFVRVFRVVRCVRRSLASLVI